MRLIKNILVCLSIALFFSHAFVFAQNNETYTLTAESLTDNKPVDLDKLQWKFHPGDDSSWADPQFDDSAWEQLEKPLITPESSQQKDWKGRGWFRLRIKIDETLKNKNLALIPQQKGASEVYLDGRRLAVFGEITDSGVSEYNPSRLPIPFHFEEAGEHVFAVRFASATFKDFSQGTARWLTSGGVFPGFSFSLIDADDLNVTIRNYANGSSMRIGFLFIGVLFALSLLHFLLYIFYRVERGNLFYSIYAAAFAVLLICGNFRSFGHQPPLATVIFTLGSIIMMAVAFVALLTFLHVAFERRFGKLYWALTFLWALCVVIQVVLFGNAGILGILPNIAISLSFAFCIWLLVKALIERRNGAWILMIGVQIFAFAMFGNLINRFSLFNLPPLVSLLAELGMILSVPLAVSVFLAHNFARTNRDLKTQLAQVEVLSRQKIEQERHAADLRAENERRTKELEEARQLQLSMLPKKVPQFANMEIAAYMKPATEVGGDYYDFHVATDGTLTIAVGDATGHGLKAGTVVTATKGLFNNLAHAPDITDTFRQISSSLKQMNLRGLFMAMTMLKVKNNQVSLSSAGMPSVLVYRDFNKQVEEISIKAMPLGSISNYPYKQIQVSLSIGDCVVVMSDGFSEMFNEAGEMIADETAKQVLSDSAGQSPQEIINRFVETGQNWAGLRPADDDVTFVVLKVV